MRDRFNAFVERHDVAWELSMALLAVVYVAVGFAGDDPARPMAPTLEGAETILTVLFAAEFGTRFAAARNRAAYLRSHWIDLVALVPAARGFRILRTLRLLRLVRLFAGVYRALGHVGALADHRGLQTIVLSWLGVMVICCAAIYYAERDVVGTAIQSPFDALWWGISTMTTVGYGDVVPQTPEGRIAASALMLLGIGLFSAVTAIITSFLVADRSAPPDPISAIERLARLAKSGAISPDEFAAKRVELLGRV